MLEAELEFEEFDFDILVVAFVFEDLSEDFPEIDFEDFDFDQLDQDNITDKQS